jgi:ATP-dependent Lon protease
MHLHIPEGANPKDGFSRVNMCVSMISTLAKTKVRKDVARQGINTKRQHTFLSEDTGKVLAAPQSRNKKKSCFR